MSPETSSGTNADPTGVLSERADGLALVLSRTYPASVADVWDCVTESERLSRWFGEWGGDPAKGFVLLRMTAKGQDVAAVRCDIVACDPPWLLQVRTTGEYRRLGPAARAGAEPTLAAGRTTVTFSQLRVEPEALADVGPGWESPGPAGRCDRRDAGGRRRLGRLPPRTERVLRPAGRYASRADVTSATSAFNACMTSSPDAVAATPWPPAPIDTVRPVIVSSATTGQWVAPNGVMVPRSYPVTARAVAESGMDSRLTPRWARQLGQEISRSPGTRTYRKSSSARRTTRVLMMSAGRTPRTCAASSRLRTGPCRVIVNAMPLSRKAATATSLRSSLTSPTLGGPPS